jgi:hypothetical protein
MVCKGSRWLAIWAPEQKRCFERPRKISGLTPMTKPKRLILSLPLFVFALGLYGQEAKITVQVTDENGMAISNAQVNAGFMTAMQPGEGWGTGGQNLVSGLTDANGFFSASGQATAGSIGLSVSKDGYYDSGGQSIIPNRLESSSHRWVPWNPLINVVLQKKGIQVPMYARRVHELKIPEQGRPVGFDLMAGDWVAPYGKGEISDFFFGVNSKTNQVYPFYDITLNVGFSNDGDGIQSIIAPKRGASELRLPRQAPIESYKPALKMRNCREPNEYHTDFRDDQNYFFRVRTKKDAQGTIVSALYGKISGDFLVSGSGDDKITFIYYLNPKPNDRNMEFDVKQNLSKNLLFMQGVNQP